MCQLRQWLLDTRCAICLFNLVDCHLSARTAKLTLISFPFSVCLFFEPLFFGLLTEDHASNAVLRHESRYIIVLRDHC